MKPESLKDDISAPSHSLPPREIKQVCTLPGGQPSPLQGAALSFAGKLLQ